MLAIAKGLKPLGSGRGASRHAGRGLRRRLRRPRHRRLPRRARARRRRARRRRGEDRRAARAARSRSTSPGSTSSSSGTRERLRFTTDVGEAVDGAEVVLRRRRHSADRTPATPTCPPSGRSSTSSRRSTAGSSLAMKSTVPVGTGRAVRHRLDERGLENVGYVSNPEFTAEGTAVQRLHAPGPHRHRRVRRGGRRRRRASSTTGIDAPVVRCDVAVGGDDQARGERGARHAHLASSTRSRTCARRRAPTCSTVAEGIGLDRRIGPAFLRAGIGFGGSCFPKDSLALKQLAANSGYSFQLLNAVIEVNELQKRRVDREARAATRAAARQDGRAARARVQARDGRHARGAEPRARRRGCSRRAPR